MVTASSCTKMFENNATAFRLAPVDAQLDGDIRPDAPPMSAMRAAQVVSARFRFLDTGGGSPAGTYVSQAAHAAPGCGTSSRRTS